MNPWTNLIRILVDAFSFVLDFIFNFTGNYALAIILMTILLNIAFTPMRIKSTKSTKMMQLLQPKIDEINKKYKDDKERISKETMELWKKYDFNPVAGCGPALAQMPLFIAMFEILRNLTFPDGTASFLWIENIALQESVYGIVLFGSIDLKILPLIAGVASYYQGKFLALGSPQSGAQGSNQMMMTVMMPAMMIWICWSNPASLSLYWATSQICYAIQQAILQRYIKVELLPEDSVKSSK